MSTFFTIKDIIEATGLSRATISQKIKDGEFQPSNAEYRYYDGGEYRFTEEEFNRIVEDHQKPGLTTGEAAKMLGVSITKVHQLIDAGELPCIEKVHGQQVRKYIKEEDIQKYIEENGKKERSVHYLSEKGYCLFQSFAYKDEKARLIDLQEDGNGSILTESGKIIPLAEAKYIGFSPVTIIEDKDYSRRTGWISFSFHRPQVIQSPIYTIIEWFYHYAGPKNVRIQVDAESIHVQVKPCLLPASIVDSHLDEIQILKSHLKEGKVLRNSSKGIWLQSDYVDVQGSVHRNLKKKMDQLIDQGAYPSIKELIEVALKEKIEKDSGIRKY